jgi:carboxymethylenebutenolidase
MTIVREGEDIEYEGIAPGGGEAVASAYLAKPASGSGCGIVIIHDDWGLTDFVRDVCDRLARSGFVAMAPDLFHGETATDSKSAEQLTQEFDLDVADADLESAVEQLYNQNATSGAKVGVLGFGVGGTLALYLSSRHRRVGAVVDLYGTQLDIVGNLERVAAPVFAVMAGEGESGSDAVVAELRATLERAGVNASVESRASLRCGFMNDARLDVYDAVAAAEIWDSLLAFFRSELV